MASEQEPRCKSFLPVWEGGSVSVIAEFPLCGFPPCMGGWIEKCMQQETIAIVSSLYGRVDRPRCRQYRRKNRFLLAREGASGKVFL